MAVKPPTGGVTWLGGNMYGMAARGNSGGENAYLTTMKRTIRTKCLNSNHKTAEAINGVA